MITGGYALGFSQMNETVYKHCGDYAALIDLYDNLHDKDGSLVIYYENFVTHPDIVLENVIDYVLSMSASLHGDLPTETEMRQNLLLLLDDLPRHRAQCLEGYRGTVPGTAHSGRALSSSPQTSNPLYYSERSNTLDLKKVDSYLYNNVNQNIYQTYLARYREKE